MITLKNPAQIAKMRSAGHLLYDVLESIREVIKAGESTAAIDAYAEEKIRRAGAIPSFLVTPASLRSVMLSGLKTSTSSGTSISSRDAMANAFTCTTKCLPYRSTIKPLKPSASLKTSRAAPSRSP